MSFCQFDFQYEPGTELFVSFDITFHFTIIPIPDSITIIEDLLSRNDRFPNHLFLVKKWFTSTYCLFHGRFYQNKLLTISVPHSSQWLQISSRKHLKCKDWSLLVTNLKIGYNMSMAFLPSGLKA